ncbi:MAG: fibronectin type III domain-containing protein, partial [Huintestinicola sp.]
PSSVQNAVPEFFNGCVKLTWGQVPSAEKYAVKICNTDGTIVKTYYVANKFTALIVPETVFAVDYNSKKDFYACVIALKRGESDLALKTYYAPSASKFTVKSDMSEYPKYGTAQDITFMTNNGKLLIGWKNPNDFAEKKDIFVVNVDDPSGKTVFTQTSPSCQAEVKGLKDGVTYKIKIHNETFSAMNISEFKFVSDVKDSAPGQGSTETPPKKGSEYTLPAPLSISVKPGDSKLTLSWSSVDEAYAYRVYMYDAKTKKYKRYKTVKSPKCTVKDLTNGKSYKFKIVALRYDSATKKYTPGKTSKTVTGTPKKPSSTVSKKSQT